MKLYFDCSSGISGDMTLGALLDLGACKKTLIDGLESMDLGHYHLQFDRTFKCGIDAYNFDVHIPTTLPLHHHHHEHEHEHEHHEHEHRGLVEINKLIDNSSITQNAKDIAKKIFYNLGVAESIAHNVDINSVHFHEVGAIDSIIDIVGTAICIDNLNPEEIYFSKLNEGTGFVKCQHGTIPVPVPAVLNLVKAHNIPLNITNIIGELVTPTGAAIAATLATAFKTPQNILIKDIGIGAGNKDFSHANILRVLSFEEGNSEQIIQIDTNIDDQTGETLSYAMTKLFDNGALDCWFTPIIMKKNRPANTLSVLTTISNKDNILKTLFKHTTTIGVRFYNVDREICKREILKINTIYGEATIKKITYNNETKVTSEYENAKEIADKLDISIIEVMNEIINTYNKTSN